MSHDPESGCILWHCTEGKDRCGLLSMLLLSMLGVDRENIMEDYLLTNEFNVERAEAIYQKALAQGMDENSADAIKQSFLAKEEYMAAAFKAIDDAYGGTEAYIREGLGITDPEVLDFREKILL